MAYATLTEKLLGAIDRAPSDRAVILRVNGRWNRMSVRGILRRIAGVSNALEQLGVKAGDRVGLFAPNRPSGTSPISPSSVGSIDVQIYSTIARPDRLHLESFRRGDCLCGGRDANAPLLECRTRLTSVKAHHLRRRASGLGDDVLRMRRFRGGGDEAIAEYRLREARVTSTKSRRLLYVRHDREPKGVVLTHNNLSSNEEVIRRVVRDVLRRHGVSFLPLSHVYEALSRTPIYFARARCLRRAHEDLRRPWWRFTQPWLPPSRACLKTLREHHAERA